MYLDYEQGILLFGYSKSSLRLIKKLRSSFLRTWTNLFIIGILNHKIGNPLIKRDVFTIYLNLNNLYQLSI